MLDRRKSPIDDLLGLQVIIYSAAIGYRYLRVDHCDEQGRTSSDAFSPQTAAPINNRGRNRHYFHRGIVAKFHPLSSVHECTKIVSVSSTKSRNNQERFYLLFDNDHT